MDKHRPLTGKVALVTGASRRIGRATVLGLADAGANVVVHARASREEVEAVAQEAREKGVQAITALGDVSDEADAAAIVRAADEAFGRIDILVNNAAIRGEAPLLTMTLGEWREKLAVILDGAFLMSRETLKVMTRVGEGGTIVNIGGATAHTGANARAHVSAAKAGLVGLTKAIAVEFADRAITANCVAPGKIGGPRSATSGASPGMGAAKILVGREGEIEEAAHMILAMCMPAARFMTGQTVHVSGGLYMP